MALESAHPFLSGRGVDPPPRVLIVGGEDVDKRLELMRKLRADFEVAAAGSDRALQPRFAREGFSFYYYPLERGADAWADLRTAFGLIGVLRAFRPHIVHTFASKPCVWGRIVARCTGVPVVIGTMPGLGSLFLSHDWKTKLVRRIYSALQRTACSLSDLTIVQNEQDARDLLEAGIVRPERTRILPGSGVATSFFHPDAVSTAQIQRFRAEIDVPPDAVLVTMVARVVRTKGVLEFAEAAVGVRDECPEVRFLLIGPDDQESWDRLAPEEQERVAERVRWIGERTDVRTVLAASDIFVLPSYREGLSRVLLEAASMKLPLVAGDVPGCQEVVHHGSNGLLVPPRDVEKLVSAVRTLVRNPDQRKRFGEASRALVVQRFDLATVARKTNLIYRELLTGVGTPAGG